MGRDMVHYKYCRVVKMDRQGRYEKICKDNKPIENNLEKQLKKFKSTLNNGKEILTNEEKANG